MALTKATGKMTTFLNGATGSVKRDMHDKLADVVSVKDFGAVGDGVTDDTAAIQAALDSGAKKIMGSASDTYKITDTLTAAGVMFDADGSTIAYTGATNKFAVVAYSTGDETYKSGFKNATVTCTSTDTVNRTHGINLGGSLTILENIRVQGFTGISVGLGGGVTETYTGVTLPAATHCYYCSVRNINVVSTAGWNFVVAAQNNANYFDNLSTFPYNGFSESPPRTANCIDELVIIGISNVFNRVSLEASPSNRMVLLKSTANQNVINGLYLETNPSWATPPDIRIEAEAQSTANVIDPIRHPYSNKDLVNDAGTANKINVRPSFYLNGTQTLKPISSQNMVLNGDFAGGASTNWSDFGTNTTPSFGTGYLSGSSWRMDIANGRVSMFQNLATAFGVNATNLDGVTCTVACWMRTDLSDVQLRLGNRNSNLRIGDGNWHFVNTTANFQSGSPSINVTNENSGQTGYVEISNVTCVVGTEPLAL